MNTNKSRTQAAILNIIFNFFYQMINTIVNIILPPLIINQFGSVINGLISTIKLILGYVQLLGAGIAESTVVSLYKPIANKEHSQISAIFNACSKVFFKMGILFQIASFLLAFIYPFFIKDELNYFFLVLLILILAIAGASEFFVIGKCRSLLLADQKIYIVNIAQIFGALGNLIITIILINYNCSIIIVQLGSSIIYVMRILILMIYVKKHYKFLDKKINPDFKAISKRKSATIHQLAGLISFGSQTILVSSFCGLAEASVYSVYNLVFVGVNTVLSTISSALLPSFGDIIAKNDTIKLKKIFSQYECFYYILVFSLYSITYIMFIPFISLYTNGISDINYIRPEYSLLFCVMGIINCLRTPGATLINAIGHYKETQNRALIEMGICFILEVLLINKFGGIGVLIGTIIAYLYRTIDVIIYSNHKILQQKTIKTIQIIIYNLIICITFFIIRQFLLLQPSSYFIWLLYAFIISIFVIGIFSLLNIFISKNEYKELINRFKRN